MYLSFAELVATTLTREYSTKRIFNQETELVHDLEPIQVSVVEARNSKASTQWPERMTVVR